MNLKSKKELAARVLKVGKARIYFNPDSLKQIDEAITRQDFLDLQQSGALFVKEIAGRRKIIKRKHKRGRGKIKKTVNTGKRDYVILTRKLRKHTKVLKRREQITIDKYKEIRRKIRASKFKSKRHLIESEVNI